jgi:MFS family permease
MPETRLASLRSRRGLDWFTFFIANLQTGFGPFVSVYLTTERWTQGDIGLVLTLGGLVGLFFQVPGGALVDATTSKRSIAAWSLLGVGASALAVAASSHFLVILAAWILHAAASCILTPAIAAISLGLVGHRGLARRLGRNASFASIGSGLAAAAMGGIGYYVSNQAVFIVTAILLIPSLLALRHIQPIEIDAAIATGEEDEPESRKGAGQPWRAFVANRPLLILVVSILLFYLANAAMLPLVGSALTLRSKESPAMLIAACIIVPQAMVAVLSPLVGSLAQSWGRRPLFLLAFAVLPLKGLCFGLLRDPDLFVLAQSLDGVSAAIIGVLVPLMLADITRKTGHFALAQGVLGTGMGLGAAGSTLVAGLMADRFGSSTAFLGLAALAVLAFLLVAIAMPETRIGGGRRGAAGGSGEVQA